jgi:hypothetical protein
VGIRPDLKRQRAQQAAAVAATADKTPPFDAEEHFKDYDHSAVLELSRKTLIAPATFNRKGTVELCVGATNRHKLEAKQYIHDDGSDEYDEKWLAQFGDRVFRHPRSVGGRTGVKNLRSNIVKSILGDYEPDTFKPWIKEDFGEDGPEYLYMVDSDGYHDPHFFYRLHEIMELSPNFGAICLYNAKFHSPRRGKTDVVNSSNTTVRTMGAGISMFFRMKSFTDNPTKIQVPDRRGWDGFYSYEIAKRKVVTSLVSFVEHFGKWGFHNKGNFDRDRALRPTKHLFGIRPEGMAKLDAEHAKTQKRMSKEK